MSGARAQAHMEAHVFAALDTWLGDKPCALAVSGGPDSLALMYATAAWAKARGYSQPLVLTVDHGARRAAKAEAAFVVRQARALGLRALKLGPPPMDQVPKDQAGFRSLRYALMDQACRKAGIAHLVLAHHLDDQAETLLMRLARGANLDGLAGMAPISRRGALCLVRPLLEIAKADLALILGDRPAIEDPSNRDGRHERVRWRQALASPNALGLTPAKLAEAARNLRRASDALSRLAEDLARASLFQDGFANLHLMREALERAPEDLRLRVLAHAAQSFGGPAPRWRALEQLWLALSAGRSRSFGGALWRLKGLDHIEITREAAALAGPQPAPPGSRLIYDGRIEAVVTQDAPKGLVLAPLGLVGAANVPKASLKTHELTMRRAAVLPALFAGEKLRAVPMLEPCAFASVRPLPLAFELGGAHPDEGAP